MNRWIKKFRVIFLSLLFFTTGNLFALNGSSSVLGGYICGEGTDREVVVVVLDNHSFYDVHKKLKETDAISGTSMVRNLFRETFENNTERASIQFKKLTNSQIEAKYNSSTVWFVPKYRLTRYTNSCTKWF